MTPHENYRANEGRTIHWRAVRTLVTRDLKIVIRSKGVILPLILLPSILMVALPALSALAPLLETLPEASMTSDIDQMLAMLPPQIMADLAGYTQSQIFVYVLLVYLFAPLFLIVPLMVASTIAASSFAGEKERGTLEALLYTPTTDVELFLGKTLAAWIPAVLVAVGSFVLYGLVANVAAWPTMGRVFFPTPMWLALVLWVAPAAAGLGLGTMVLVSSKVGTFQEAYQIGSAVVIPVVLLMIGQMSGLLYFSVGLILAVGLVLWIIDAAILWLAVRTFQRSEIIARL